MTRAAKRQRKKVSRQAAQKLRTRPARSGSKPARAAPGDYNAQLIQKGIALQMAGRTAEAEALYRQVLQAKPSHADANHLLGVLAKQAGALDTAHALIAKAIKADPSQPLYHANLGSVFGDMGRLDEAADCYRTAIALKPDFPEAHFNLAGVALQRGCLDEAIAGYGEAVALRPDYTDAQFKLGFALQQSGRLEEALASYQRVLASDPNHADAHGNLATLYHVVGRPNDAFAHSRTAVALKPAVDAFWNGLAICLGAIRFDSADDEVLAVLQRLLDRPRISPNLIARPILSALRAHPETAPGLARAEAPAAEVERDALEIAARLSAVPLFLRLISLSVINDAALERSLTALRRGVLLAVAARGVETPGDAHDALPFLAALALHGFTNEYVFDESPDETAAVETLEQAIAAMLRDGRDVPPALVALLGAYRPLHRLPFAEALAACDWPAAVAEVVERQIAEPRAEAALRGDIPRLTPIDDAVSQAVRAQYEENPYPRWIKTALEAHPRPIREVLQGPPLYFDLGDAPLPEAPEILIAGCGTGQHALTTAATYRNATLLAVDLSLASLAYAVRQARALGFETIDFAQADIMELGRLDRRFDLIESSGVLHHLADPLAGWRVLTGLLKPGGFMKVALYSELARAPVVAARELIAAKGYGDTAQDIRQCRAEIRAKAAAGDEAMAELASLLDFYGLSNCRDLIFHVQEHRFTLPQIDDALQTLGLDFLGFELGDAEAIKRFKTLHPEPGAMTSLAKWHAFEQDNPRTFAGMYQLWCRKR